jgi:hypothetical protein
MWWILFYKKYLKKNKINKAYSIYLKNKNKVYLKKNWKNKVALLNTFLIFFFFIIIIL